MTLALVLALSLGAEPVVVVRAGMAKAPGDAKFPDIPVLVPVYCAGIDGGCLDRAPAITQVQFLDKRRVKTVGLEALREKGAEVARPLWRVDPEKKKGVSDVAVWPASALQSVEPSGTFKVAGVDAPLSIVRKGHEASLMKGAEVLATWSTP